MKSVVQIIVAFCALCLLSGCGESKEQMLQQLELLEQANVDDEKMENDSLAEALVTYFDSHGSRNERMRAKYILGRTYYDLGELPRALETYYEAADCADTTASDCDFAKLSRIHAQTAAVYASQIQPRSQQQELRKAEYFAMKGKDTLMAIECYAMQASSYRFMNAYDSVIAITDQASVRFNQINRIDRANQVLAKEISSLVKIGNYKKAKECIDNYFTVPGSLDGNGDIVKGQVILYYILGEYYLAVNKLDSAEYLFRKEQRLCKDLNNQIAACKGLQKLYERKKIPDSIAKYANLGYELNDSAYSLSEMENIQKLRASYNYNHQKYLAEKKRLEALVAWLLVALIIVVVIAVGLVFFRKYLNLRKIAVDFRLRNAEVTKRLRRLALSNPPQYPDLSDWEELRNLVEREIPNFRSALNNSGHPLSEMEYDVCLMVRVHLYPKMMANLKQTTPSNISNIRKRLYQKIFHKEGGSEDFDDEIGNFGA